MTKLHPITPSPELIEEWIELSRPTPVSYSNPNVLATYAARWGADQELDACCEHLQRSMSPKATIDYLRAARRPKPKPPSLKDQIITAIFRDDKSLALKLLNQALPE